METPSVVIPHASTIVPHLTEKLKQASDAYYYFLIKKCLEAIQEMKEKYTLSAILSDLHEFKYEDVPQNTVHYGIFISGRTRKPLIEGEEMPFIKAQRKMYEHGYYLLDLHDSGNYIALYAARPSYLDNPDKLWH